MKVINKESLLETFQYFDKPIVVEIIDIFINEQPKRMETIEKAIRNKDFETIKFEAHSLKGVIANFVAELPHSQARDLEIKCKEEDSSGLEELLEALKISTSDLVDDLNALRPDFVE